MENVRQTCNQCCICQEVRPQYYKPHQPRLMKASQLLKGSIVHYHYSRFPFAYPVKDISPPTVMNICYETRVWKYALLAIQKSPVKGTFIQDTNEPKALRPKTQKTKL